MPHPRDNREGGGAYAVPRFLPGIHSYESGLLAIGNRLAEKLSFCSDPIAHSQSPIAYAFKAASTSATWSSTLTFRKIAFTAPPASMTKVLRSMPQNFLPYMLFSL